MRQGGRLQRIHDRVFGVGYEIYEQHKDAVFARDHVYPNHRVVEVTIQIREGA